MVAAAEAAIAELPSNKHLLIPCRVLVVAIPGILDMIRTVVIPPMAVILATQGILLHMAVIQDTQAILAIRAVVVVVRRLLAILLVHMELMECQEGLRMVLPMELLHQHKVCLRCLSQGEKKSGGRPRGHHQGHHLDQDRDRVEGDSCPLS